MGNMLIAPVADATERVRADTFIHAHTGSSPYVDRRIAVTDVVTKDASGNSGVGVTPAPWFSNRKAMHFGSVGTSIAGFTGNGLTEIRNNTYLNASGNEIYASSSGASKLVFNANDMVFSVAAFGSAGDTATFIERLKVNFDGHLTPGADNTQTMGSASKRWSVVYAGTGAINTSDKDEKTDIEEIPDAWLDAWADAQWVRFKFVDRVRWHIGLVAQQVHATFAAHGIDAFEIGLCCYDTWEEEREPIFETVTRTRATLITEYVAAGVNEQGQTLFTAHEVEGSEEYQESIDTGETRVTMPAGDLWGLRYDECEAMEAAYQRREMGRMAARLAALENQV